MRPTSIVIVYFMGFIFALCSANGADVVTRNISLQHGFVVVTDRLSIDEDFAAREPNLWALYKSVQSGDTNILDKIRSLFFGEALDVERFDSHRKGDKVDISIMSRVKFDERGKSANLRWLPTWGGESMDFTDAKVSLGRGQAEMIIFKSGNVPILWFPDLGPADDFLKAFDTFKSAFVFPTVTNEMFECTINDADNKTVLFLRRPAGASTVPDIASLGRLNKLHAISSNDFISICTGTKIAKGGYYVITPMRQ